LFCCNTCTCGPGKRLATNTAFVFMIDHDRNYDGNAELDVAIAPSRAFEFDLAELLCVMGACMCSGDGYYLACCGGA